MFLFCEGVDTPPAIAYLLLLQEILDGLFRLHLAVYQEFV